MSINRPEVHGFMKEMNKEVLSHYDCFASVTPSSYRNPAKIAQCRRMSWVCRSCRVRAVFDTREQGAPNDIPLPPVRTSYVCSGESDRVRSQSFDRAGGGLERMHDPEWKLSALKKVFNTWQVEMEEAGGWNSN